MGGFRVHSSARRDVNFHNAIFGGYAIGDTDEPLAPRDTAGIGLVEQQKAARNIREGGEESSIPTMRWGRTRCLSPPRLSMSESPPAGVDCELFTSPGGLGASSSCPPVIHQGESLRLASRTESGDEIETGSNHRRIDALSDDVNDILRSETNIIELRSNVKEVEANVRVWRDVTGSAATEAELISVDKDRKGHCH